ncbi:MAG TPA: cupin domain-containing protein [Longimicrobium sp.]|nr:cupin domain-containing protein [Longimicrobium sp.]
MRRPALQSIVTALMALGCGGGEPKAARDAGETHSGLAAAGGVTQAPAGADARKARIVPLGPMGGDVEILSGHPDSAGPFVMRIKELPGSVVPPHTHPVDENITVVSGTWHFAVGERFDTTALRPMTTGTYAFVPKGATMFAASPDGAVVQVHGNGPFHIHWRDGLRVLSDSGASAKFRFRIDEAVSAPRGDGRIRQGYGSGTLIQYEIVQADGRVFMAHERDLRRR